MSKQKGLPKAGALSSPEISELSLDEDLLAEAPKSEMNNESDGSIASHLMYGLGSLVLVLPMLLPGIPMSWLAVFYVGLIVVGIVGYMVWSAFSTLKTRRLRRH